MYLNHFGLNEPPFRITPHTSFFFGGANRGATLEALLYAITHTSKSARPAVQSRSRHW
jgi:MSHA biogenesis protein MshM